jgi:hypothetical protein
MAASHSKKGYVVSRGIANLIIVGTGMSRDFMQPRKGFWTQTFVQFFGHPEQFWV